MRCVKVVKKKRDELKAERERFMRAKERLYPYPKSYPDIPKEEQHQFTYLMNTVGHLDKQINALEFVLNEDTELKDVTELNFFNVDKEALLKEPVKKTGCQCPHCTEENNC